MEKEVTPAPTAKKMSAMPSLTKAQLNFAIFRNDAAFKIERIMKQAGGINVKNKSIIFQDELVGPIGLLVETGKLKDMGAVSFHILEDLAPQTPVEHLVYIVRPILAQANMIIKQIEFYQKKQKENPKEVQRKFHIVCMPEKNINFERFFECAGVWKDVRVTELSLTWVPLDCDLLSLESPGSFRESSLNQSNAPLFHLARALMILQEKFGVIPFIQGKGDQSQFIIQEMLTMRKTREWEHVFSMPSQIGRMIIIDRECDYATPMLTQLCYQGMIDEVMGVKDGTIEVPISLLMERKKPKPGEKEETKVPEGKRAFPLNSDDVIFESIRDLGFNSVGPFLKDRLRKVSMAYESAKAGKSGTLAELNASVNLLASINAPQRLLTIHWNVADSVIANLRDNHTLLDTEQNILIGAHTTACKEFIATQITGRKIPPERIIRLICLMSLVNDGIDFAYCRQLDSLVVKNYGAKYCFLFENLFKIGLLHPQDEVKAWDYAKRHLSLFVPDYNEQDPTDLSYVYGGVAPISCRLVEHALTVPISALANAKKKDVLVKGWGDSQIDKKIKRVKGGAAFYLVQTIDFEKIAKNLKSLTSIILIVFVGGITYSEIAALRFLAKRNPGKTVIVATPKVINGTNFIESLL